MDGDRQSMPNHILWNLKCVIPKNRYRPRAAVLQPEYYYIQITLVSHAWTWTSLQSCQPLNPAPSDSHCNWFPSCIGCWTVGQITFLSWFLYPCGLGRSPVFVPHSTRRMKSVLWFVFVLFIKNRSSLYTSEGWGRKQPALSGISFFFSCYFYFSSTDSVPGKNKPPEYFCSNLFSFFKKKDIYSVFSLFEKLQQQKWTFRESVTFDHVC